MLDSYQLMLAMLNADVELKKTTCTQLETSKRMIKAHFDNDIAKESIKEGDFMTIVCVSNRSNQGYGNKTGLRCDHCNRNVHTTKKIGSHFAML